MTEIIVCSVLGLSVVSVFVICDHAFHSWLKQRERERLTATDKAELLQRLKEVDTRLLDLKNTIPRPR